MARREPQTYRLTPIKGKGREPTFLVSVAGRDIGTVSDTYIRHMGRRGWEATGYDGHRGMHDQQWQAILALAWDGTGQYPFPYAASRQREVIIGGE